MAIDIFSLQPNKISRDLRSKFILLAGAPKIGKTEFCAQSDKALILATEIGTNAQSGVRALPIQKFADFKLVLRQLEKPEAKQMYSTICIDTIGILYDLCEQFVCQQNGVSKIGDIPYGGGYSQTSKEFENCLRKITMMGYGLIMTCHLKETADDDGKVVGYKPDLNNRCLKIVNGLVDIIGVITQTWNEKGESERWIQTRATPTITAGSRYKYLEPRIPFGFHELEQAVAKAIDMEEKNGGLVTDEAPIIQEEKLDFNALMSEAREIWTTKVNNAKTDEDKKAVVRAMSKKVEMVFGRKLKLSEVTEDQVSLLQLAVMDLRAM